MWSAVAGNDMEVVGGSATQIWLAVARNDKVCGGISSLHPCVCGDADSSGSHSVSAGTQTPPCPHMRDYAFGPGWM